MKEKIYETPSISEIEMIVEQAVLAASVGDYPSYSGDEEDLGF